MNRSIDSDTTDRLREEHPNSRMPLSQGRAGGASSGESSAALRDRESFCSTTNRHAPADSELATLIDETAAGTPTMSEFVERLGRRGVQAIPSIQSSGRLNGMAYRYQGVVVKGSHIGRAYTAQGL